MSGRVVDADTVVRELGSLVAQHGGQSAFARVVNVKPSYVNDVLRGRRALHPRMLEQLGYVAITRYVRVRA